MRSSGGASWRGCSDVPLRQPPPAPSLLPPLAQIRVHARHIGHPLFADDTYSSLAAAGSIVGAGKPARAAAAQAAARQLGRPALHAQTLGFVHPATAQRLEFAVLRAPPFV